MTHPSRHYRSAEDWSAMQYLKFEDERTRPPRDLLAQVPLQSPRRVVDLGCGPGNSTELLIKRFPGAQILGIDTSQGMLQQARGRLPGCTFVQGDLSTWMPEPDTDLLFGNAVFHWVPDHPSVLARLLGSLPPGGVLAVQMPDNTSEPALLLMEKVATSLAQPCPARAELPKPEAYYDLLRPICRHVDIWHTRYNHILDDHRGVVEWFKGSGMRPFLAPLSEPSRKAFLARYSDAIRRAYPARSDGKVLLPFPRLFIVAER
ncbi:MAG TPA: trans-aconitate 2-methyltransferase [Hyphomicrobiaceae bacterium]|jgi:trans-aconitate 2-methyltransferase